MAGGRRGPPPKPAALAALGPAPRHKSKAQLQRERPGANKIAVVGAPDVPESVKKDRLALQTWRHLRSRLVKLKVLTKDDAHALEGLCVAYSRAVKADKIVRQKGLVTEDLLSGQLRPNPAVRISTIAWAEVRKFAQEFGLTPAARTRVREIEDPSDIQKEKDNAEEFLFGSAKKAVAGGRVAGHIAPKK